MYHRIYLYNIYIFNCHRAVNKTWSGNVRNKSPFIVLDVKLWRVGRCEIE